MRHQRSVPVRDTVDASVARRAAAELAWELGFDDTAAGRLAIVVTELATNIAKHAGEGELLLGVAAQAGPDAVEVIALDRGPGMENLDRCLGDGYSTAGSPGTGLGAVRRQSTYFDVTSTTQRGTAILARVAAGRGVRPALADALDVGYVSVAKPGEELCGDGCAVSAASDGAAAMVVDGLGHGPLAFEASEAATKVFAGSPEHTPRIALETVHDALRATRGAAAAVAHIDVRRRIVTYAGVGNIAGAILSASGDRRMVSHGGIVGHDARRIHEFTYPWPDDAVLVMASDGIVTQWDVVSYPGLLSRAPSLIAGVLYRDFGRRRDDTTVLVARQAGRPA